MQYSLCAVLHSVNPFDTLAYLNGRFRSGRLVVPLGRTGPRRFPASAIRGAIRLDAVLAAMHQFENRLCGAGGRWAGCRARCGKSGGCRGHRSGIWWVRRGTWCTTRSGALLVRWGFERVATRGVHAGGGASAVARARSTDAGRAGGLQADVAQDAAQRPLAGRVVNEEWGVDVEACYEPIVSRRTFVQVQEVLAGRRHVPGPAAARKLDHPDFGCPHLLQARLTPHPDPP